MSSLLHPVRPHFGLAAAGFVLAQMLWDLWGTISARLCSVCTSLFLWAQHTQTLLTGKYWEKDKKQSLRDSPLSHRLLGSQTQCSDQVLFSKALFSFRATPPSLLCLWFTQDPLWTWKIASLHVSLCVCLQPHCYHPENDVKSSFFSSWSG